MAGNFQVSVKMTVREDGVELPRFSTDGEGLVYNYMDYEDVVQFEKALMMTLGQLGDAKVAEKKEKAKTGTGRG